MVAAASIPGDADAFNRLDAELRDDYGPLETARTRRTGRARS